MMLVDINQWRAAIGCFRAFTCRSARFRYVRRFFSVLLQIIRLYQFAVWFIFISLLILPLSVAAHLFVHKIYPESCFLPLFSRLYSCVRILLYVLSGLLKWVPFYIVRPLPFKISYNPLYFPRLCSLICCMPCH